MINLFTGAPGTGKTAYVLSEMLRLLPDGRPLYVHGVPELKIPHTSVVCSSLTCKVCPELASDREGLLLAEDWDQWAPDGAIILFDEVQNIYRPRGMSVKPPSSIMAFETHRHKGLDFYLASQSPMLFDGNIRRLVNRHIHLKAKWALLKQYEWGECFDNPSKSTTGAVESKYKINKKVFDLYKSASLHTEVKRKIPPAVYALGFLLVALVVGGNMIFRSLEAKTNSAPVAAEDSGLFPSDTVYSDVAPSASVQPGIYLSRDPVLKNYPESAPLYSTVIEVTDFPVMLAVIIREETGDCKAFTQQGTLYRTSQRQCHLFYKGRVFNPYKSLLKERRNNQKNNKSDSRVVLSKPADLPVSKQF